MLRSNNKYSILIAALSGAFLLQGFVWRQNNPQAKTDFTAINKAYEMSEKYSMSISYNLYQNYTSLSPVETEKGIVSRNGKDFYSKMFNIETIRNDKMTLSVDHEDKVMIVDDFPKSPQGEAFLTMSVDTLLSTCSEVKMRDVNAGSRSYKLTFNDWKYKTIEIIFNRKTFFIEKMTLYFNNAVKLGEDDDPNVKEDKPRIEIVYSQVNTTSSSAQASVSKYITKVKNEYVANKTYNDYQVLYNKQEKP